MARLLYHSSEQESGRDEQPRKLAGFRELHTFAHVRPGVRAHVRRCARHGAKQDSMAVSFFGGQDGAGARVWSAGKFVTNQQDKEKLRARIRELESLCTDVLVAGVDIGLPQQLLNQLWAAVGHGELPHAYHVDLPPAPPRPIEGQPAAATVSVRRPTRRQGSAATPRAASRWKFPTSR